MKQNEKDLSSINDPEEDPDLAPTKKMQAGYDSEYRVLSALEKRDKNTRRPPKTRRIDTIFQKR
jgi:hypothetical protein